MEAQSEEEVGPYPEQNEAGCGCIKRSSPVSLNFQGCVSVRAQSGLQGTQGAVSCRTFPLSINFAFSKRALTASQLFILHQIRLLTPEPPSRLCHSLCGRVPLPLTCPHTELLIWTGSCHLTTVLRVPCLEKVLECNYNHQCHGQSPAQLPCALFIPKSNECRRLRVEVTPFVSTHKTECWRPQEHMSKLASIRQRLLVWSRAGPA
mmetsp:Transcript_2982/g.4844  ORF Transcript_2982/g.4844 Transcript_2982/m.4844 type:complete len:206 (+) Transcript_2982:560-1177(+)